MNSTTPVIATARVAYSAGLSIIPVHEDGSKAPAVAWTKYQTERADPAQVRAWDFERRTGLGIVTGFADLTMFEFDDGALIGRFLDLAQASGLGELVERIRQGCAESTPGEGEHWYYHCADTRGNTTLAKRPQPDGKRKALIQTRGRGGYVVVAPSYGKVHPSGKPYRLLRGSFASIVTITPEEQDALWALARSFDECLRPEDVRPTPRPASPVEGDRPGDLFNAVATWDDILTPNGWVFVFQRAGVGYWRRPGKNEGISATTNWGGYDYFYPFTSSTQFDEERGYTRFSVYAHLEHGGNFNEAARALKAQGYGAQGPRFTTAKLAGERVDVATPESAVDDKDLAIAELRARLVEAERRARRRDEEQSALGQWLSKEEINPADRIIIYKVASEYAWRRQQGEEVDGYTLIRLGETDRKARARVAKEQGEEMAATATGYGLAQACGLDAKTVSKALKKYSEPDPVENPDGWGILGRQERHGRTEDGNPRSDILVRMAADRVADVLVDLLPFSPETPRNHGGKREPCPRCQSLRRRTVVTCEDCGLEFINKVDGPDELPTDEAGNIPPTPIEDLAAATPTYPVVPLANVREDEDEETDTWDPNFCNHLGCTARLNPALGKRYCWEHADMGLAPAAPPLRLPVSAAQGLDSDIIAGEARKWSLSVIDERLERYRERWAAGEDTAQLRLLLTDWRAIRAARVAYESARTAPVGAD